LHRRIKRRHHEINELESVMRQKSDVFARQRQLNDELDDPFFNAASIHA
jgi:hypothetical protein